MNNIKELFHKYIDDITFEERVDFELYNETELYFTAPKEMVEGEYEGAQGAQLKLVFEQKMMHPASLGEALIILEDEQGEIYDTVRLELDTNDRTDIYDLHKCICLCHEEEKKEAVIRSLNELYEKVKERDEGFVAAFRKSFDRTDINYADEDSEIIKLIEKQLENLGYQRGD